MMDITVLIHSRVHKKRHRVASLEVVAHSQSSDGVLGKSWIAKEFPSLDEIYHAKKNALKLLAL